MNVLLNKSIQPAKERIALLRFSIDVETQKIQIEGRSEKYDTDEHLINTEPVRLIFRDEDYSSALQYLLKNNTMGNAIHLLLRKLEIDRCLPNNTLCGSLPKNVPPYKG